MDAFLSGWTLLIKSLGLALAVSSGLSLGKEVSKLLSWYSLNTYRAFKGPLVHVSCCMARLFSKLFKQLRQNEGTRGDSSVDVPIAEIPVAQKRRILAAAAAAGVSVAFGSPLGGVLFGLEGTTVNQIPGFNADICLLELDTFSKETDVMWRGFVISVIAAVSLQYIDPFGTKKLVLFGVGVN